MDGYISISVSWHAADLASLERVAVAGQDRAAVQRRVLAAGYAEAMVVSTCSRTELHVIVDGARGESPDTGALIDLLAGGDPETRDLVARAAVVRSGAPAVEHLFRTAAGLESRAVGEVEIQAQFRAAARLAAGVGGDPHRLRRLVTAALRSARSGPVSALTRRQGLLARRAVARALQETPPDRPPLRAVVVGAGTMGLQVAEQLAAHCCRAVLVSRCPSAATPTRPRVHPLERLPHLLGDADLVFVATSAGRHVLSRSAVHRARRDAARALTFVDLSVPRNVDPSVRELPGVHLLDLDDLAAEPLARITEAERQAATETAVAGADAYLDDIRARRAGPVITAVRSRLEEVCLDKLRAGLRGADLPDEALSALARTVAGATAHPSTVLLRQAAAEHDDGLLELVARCFGVPPASASPAQTT